MLPAHKLLSSPVMNAPAPQAQTHDWLNRFRLHAKKRGLGDVSAPPAEWTRRAKNFLRLERQILLRNHRQGMPGLELVRWRATVIDVFLEQLLARALRESTPEEKAAVAFAAHGGYGRGELCPFSDIDLMILYDDSHLPRPVLAALQERVSGFVVSQLWDVNLKPGHASRTIAESVAAARADGVTRNALLDARFVAGNAALFDALKHANTAAIREDGIAGQIAFIISEKAKRHAKAGGSVFMQEPDIKNGVGGLRDYHILRWFARLLGEEERGIGGLVNLGHLSRAEADEVEKAYSHLLRVRNELHFQSRREEDVLSLEKQPVVAAALGCKGSVWTRQIEDLMRGYYKAAAGILQSIHGVEWRFEELRAAAQRDAESLSARHKRERVGDKHDPEKSVAPETASAPAPIPLPGGFLLNNGFLSAARSDIFERHPAQLMRVFRLAQEYNAVPDFPLLRLVRENIHRLTRRVAESAEVVSCFFSILADAGRTGEALGRMYESGVLCRFLPEFSGIHCLVQREIFHRYTVDVHTMLCLRELDAVFKAATPEAERYRTALLDTDEPALLFLVLLLHDIGKRYGVARHAETGAALADKILRRLKVRDSARQEIVALIRGHLDMSSFWQKHDLDDRANLDAFAQQVGTAQRLRYLYVLTYCDARATSPELWNDYKNSLHRQVFRGTLARFEHKTQEAMLRRENVEKTLAGEIASEELNAHFATVPERYFEQHTEEDVVLHIRLVNQKLRTLTSALGDGGLSPCVHWVQDGETGVSAVTIVTWDREGLFYKLAGALAVAGLSILRSRAFVRTD
ncbi:MAG: HD domain-containing protein, partial [Puniceicoccales bacterium]|nr:HD domain-containing protein [Puniceicoccales bacterium]